MNFIIDISTEGESAEEEEDDDNTGIRHSWPHAGELLHLATNFSSSSSSSSSGNINDLRDWRSCSPFGNHSFGASHQNVQELINEDSLNSEGGWDCIESKEVAMSKPERKIGEWSMLKPFDSMENFKTWKTLHTIDWHVGTKANSKIDGYYAYQNFKCKSHQLCEAQVCW